MIRNIKLESFRGLKDKSLDLSEHKVPYVLIFGDGGVGKSSFLGFLRAMLNGVVSDDDINIMEGKAAGEIEFEKNGRRYKVKLAKTRKSDTLSLHLYSDELQLWTRAGGREVLRELVGEIWIDPLALQRMKEKEQVEWYRTKTGIDTSQYDELIASYSEERTIIGRLRDDLKGYVNQSEDTFDIEANLKMYAEPRSIQELITRQQSINKQKGDRMQLDYRIKNDESAIKASQKKIKELEDAILAERAKIEGYNSSIEKLNGQLQAIPADIDAQLQEVNTQISESQEYNSKRETFLQTLEKFREFEKREAEYKSLTEQIEQQRAEKAAHIASSNIAIEGLELTDGGLRYNGIPLAALSTTEIVTLTKLIQQKVNPNGLPVMIIDDGESMGTKFLTEIDKLVSENPDLRVFISFMDRSQNTIKITMKEKI